MSGWLAEARDALSAGGHPACAAAHPHHETVLVDVDLSEPAPIPDWPSHPPRLGVCWTMEVFAADRYSVPGYCPADSEVSRGILAHGRWEGFETLLAASLLFGGWEPDGIVLDFGANVGWYSLLASRLGWPVLAVEADPVIASVLARNLDPYADDPCIAQGWIGPDTPILEPGPRVRLCKIDVEGAEAEVMRVCEALFAAGAVDYVLAEASPEFGSVAWVDALAEWGMRAHRIPDKGCDPVAFAADPLGCTLAGGEVKASGITAQCDLLLTRDP